MPFGSWSLVHHLHVRTLMTQGCDSADNARGWGERLSIVVSCGSCFHPFRRLEALEFRSVSLMASDKRGHQVARQNFLLSIMSCYLGEEKR